MDNLSSRLNQEQGRVEEYTEHLDSLYVKLFDRKSFGEFWWVRVSGFLPNFVDIYSIVLEKESYLFTEQELDYLQALHSLPSLQLLCRTRSSKLKAGCRYHPLSPYPAIFA